MCKAQGGLRMCFLQRVLTKPCLLPRWHVFPGATPVLWKQAFVPTEEGLCGLLS